jgi:carotenoid cleavage dioxygenase-like enzyme
MPNPYYPIAGFFGAIKPLRYEADVLDLEVVGDLPAELTGTLYRCGPNRLYPTNAHDTIINGDGLVSMYRFIDGHVDFRCRYVKTERYRLESAARRRLFGDYRNPYTDDPGVAVSDRDNTANTNVVAHNGRLFALREDSRPTELDPATLDTLGTWDFDGRLRSRSVTAHPKFDPETGEWWSHGFFAAGDVSKDDLSLQCIAADGRLVREEWFEGPYPGLTHDFGVTREHVIFPVMPLTTDLERLKRGGHFYAYDPSLPACFGVVSREPGSAVRWFKRKGAFMGHIMNAFTEGSKVHVDATISRGNGFAFLPDVFGRQADPEEAVATVSRLTFDLDSDGEDFTIDPFQDAIGEMPTIDPRRCMSNYRYGYMRLKEGIGKLDWQRGELSIHATPESAASEPIFVPRRAGSGEDDGFVLFVATRLKENRADLVIANASDMTAPPIAVCKLPFAAPYSFHGSWVNKGSIGRREA